MHLFWGGDNMDIKQELKNLKSIKLLKELMTTEDMPNISNELIAEKNATIDKIYSLKDNEQIKVMLFRYSEGMTWEEVSTELALSKSKLLKVHKQALTKLTRSYNS